MAGKSRRPPGLQGIYAVRLMHVMAGSSHLIALSSALVVLITLDWFSSTLYRGVQWLQGILVAWGWPAIAADGLTGLAPFLVVILWLVLAARRAANRIHVAVTSDRYPDACRVLVLFLSTPPGETPDIGAGGNFADKDVRARLAAHPWRMPCEAIAAHLPRLETVIVVPSADGGPDGARPGSYRSLPAFKELVRSLAGARPVEVLGLGEVVPRFERGIDFEDIRTLVDALQEVYARLHADHIPENEIRIDITGGTKPTTAAGATVALAEGRRFQYVSTATYEVHTYDVTYRI
ncbi:MAG TPA: hypothetical protein VKA13_01250 [Gammaproteobacteria bacterium]|nr:hypothetical protein [Gammaproteobacteria bacterium]